jgi:uncharacterized protein DUF5658
MYAAYMTDMQPQRQPGDRRQRPTPWWSAMRLHGRRRGFRRAGEGCQGFIDCPSSYVAMLVLWVTVCSAVDALLTLLYIANGGGEANPVMALAITYGHGTFVGLKMSVTGLGSWTLSVLQQFPLAYLVLHILTAIYLVIMGMHASIWLC